jgi:hypothetical protein
MKMIVVFAAVACMAIAATAPADAKGCLKGAVVGGAAGHYVGHHGLIGAAAGCLIGHHEATQREREQERARQQGGPDDRNSSSGYR